MYTKRRQFLICFMSLKGPPQNFDPGVNLKFCGSPRPSLTVDGTWKNSELFPYIGCETWICCTTRGKSEIFRSPPPPPNDGTRKYEENMRELWRNTWEIWKVIQYLKNLSQKGSYWKVKIHHSRPRSFPLFLSHLFVPLRFIIQAKK